MAEELELDEVTIAEAAAAWDEALEVEVGAEGAGGERALGSQPPGGAATSSNFASTFASTFAPTFASTFASGSERTTDEEEFFYEIGVPNGPMPGRMPDGFAATSKTNGEGRGFFGSSHIRRLLHR